MKLCPSAKFQGLIQVCKQIARTLFDFLFLSRATRHCVGLSVSWSVGRSVCVSHFNLFAFLSYMKVDKCSVVFQECWTTILIITAPAQPPATKFAVYTVLFLFTSKENPSIKLRSPRLCLNSIAEVLFSIPLWIKHSLNHPSPRFNDDATLKP